MSVDADYTAKPDLGIPKNYNFFEVPITGKYFAQNSKFSWRFFSTFLELFWIAQISNKLP